MLYNYDYVAFQKDRGGSRQKKGMLHGKMRASKKSHVRSKIYAMGYIPVSVKRARSGGEDDAEEIKAIIGKYVYRNSEGLQVAFLEDTPQARDILRFTSQLLTLIGSGVPLLQAIELLGKQQKSKVFQYELKSIYYAIQKGATFSDALARFPRRFEVLYVSIVRSGETSGNLDKALQYILDYMERNQKLASQVKSALTYPSIVIVIAIAVLGVLLKFVVPTMASNLPEGKDLPKLTQSVISLSDFVGAYWMHVAVTIAGGIAFFAYWKKTISGRFVLDRFLLNLPLVGATLKKITVSRFCNVMSSMLSSGVPLIDIFDTCVECCDNAFMSQVIVRAKKDVVQGHKLFQALADTNMMPDLVISMISVGEQSGKLDTMLLKVSEYYDEEVKLATSRLLSLIEPMLIVVIGGFIAILLLAMYLPMFDMGANV
ncbi:MAG: type II secretion system F family protein [Proteobacteria bacterium]|nr:type II secretion system F family protein [Pseudomonadota bacterium]